MRGWFSICCSAGRPFRPRSAISSGETHVNHGLGRRAFLQNAGMTALLGAVGGGAPAVAAASSGALAQAGGRFDFDTPYNRFGTNSVKYDQQIRIYGKDSVQVGMGIADMDFRAAPSITKALKERLEHENWGYLDMPASFSEGIIAWNKKRYGVTIEPSQLVIAAGVHPALIATLKAFSPKGTKVLLQTPTYNGFYSDLTASQTLAEEVPAQVRQRQVRDGLRAVREADQRRHQLLHPVQPAEPDRQLLERRGPDPHRRDLPQAPRGGAGRRDPLRLRRQGPEVHAVRQPAQQGDRRQQHHLQGRQQVVRPGRAQDGVVLLDQRRLHGPHQGAPPRRHQHPRRRRQPGRLHARGRGVAEPVRRVHRRQHHLRGRLHQQPSCRA